MDPKVSLTDTAQEAQNVAKVAGDKSDDDQAVDEEKPLEQADIDDDGTDKNSSAECFLYDMDTPPTFIEQIFGEPYHVYDKYPGHQISVRFIFTLAATYIVEGCLDWLLIAVRYYGTAVWNIGPADFQQFSTIVTFPWNVKLIYGLTIDSITFCGYRRKSYMAMFGVLGSLSMLMAVSFSESYGVQLIAVTLSQLSISFCDVIADALTVERTEFKSHTVATRLQSLAWGARSVASIAGVLVSTQMQKDEQIEDYLSVYWLYFAVSLSIPICGVLLPENSRKPRGSIAVENGSPTYLDTDRPASGSTESIVDIAEEEHYQAPQYPVRTILHLCFETICRKSIFYPLLFVFILCCTPQSGEAVTYYQIYFLGFTPVQIGYLEAVTSAAFLISIAILMVQSRKSNHNFSLKRLFLIWTIIATVLPFITLILIFRINVEWGIPDFAFMMSDTVIIKVTQKMLSMAINILFARICPPGIEGVFMTILTSVVNIAYTVAGYLSAWLIALMSIQCVEDPDDAENVICDFENLWILIVVVNLTTLVPLIFITRIPDEQELRLIGEELKDTTLDRDEEAPKKERSRDNLIGLFWLCEDRMFPFCKANVCCCACCQDDEPREVEMEHQVRSQSTVSPKNGHSIN